MTTVLIVDDRPLNRELFVSLLGCGGHRLLEASDGAQALRTIHDERPDLVITHPVMPDIDGCELVGRLRDDPATHDTAVIFYAATEEDEKVRNLARACGVSFVLTKPAEPVQILSTVSAALERAQPPSASSSPEEFDREHLRVLTNRLREKVDALEAFNARLTKLLECGVGIASENEAKGLCRMVCGAAREIVGCKYCAVGMLRRGRALPLAVFVIQGPEGDADLNAPPPETRSGFLSRILTERRSLGSRQLGLPRESLHLPLTDVVEPSFLGVPVQTSKRVYGWLYLTGKTGGGDFTEEAEKLAVMLAGKLAVGYESARLHAAVRSRLLRLRREVGHRRRAEEVLRHHAQELQEASRLKEEFLANVSHELRTPLTTILGWSSMLSAVDSDPELRPQGLRAIHRSAVLQARLVEDLLDFSTLTSSTVRVQMRLVNLGALIAAVVEDFQPVFREKSLEVAISVDDRGACVTGDRDRLQQVIWNLLSNAVKFTPSGGRVEARLEKRGPRLRFSIRDNGKGIPPSFMPHVFARFRQADASSTRKEGGFGLGLAIVRRLVEMHEGMIHVESEGEGKGATFVVELPAVDAENKPQDSSASAKRTPKLEGLRVLVVEDDPDTRETVESLLGHFGAHVTGVASVAEALAAIPLVRPNVIVSDIAMPEEDGYQLIRRIRSLAALDLRSTPAIALTAMARREDRQLALEAGFQKHVPKPVDPLDLAEAVAELAGCA